MKKTLIVNVIILCVFLTCLASFVLITRLAVTSWDCYFDFIDSVYVESFLIDSIYYTITAVLCALSLIGIIILVILLNPRLFRKSTWTNLAEEWERNKAERAAAKEAKAEEHKQAELAKKQKQLEELQSEIDELKKD